MKSSLPPLEMWGGVECTVNRVGDLWMDQLEKSGHAHRVEDLDAFAALGLKTLRYPFLWERIAPDPDKPPVWDWAEIRLNRLRQLGIRPIAGLVHHGSGPPGTSLVDPGFPAALAAYAGAFAQRFPDVIDYTPVNEPLTTARFSGLYGLWYPHGHDDRIFVRALLNQTRGTVLAMQAIRQFQPSARLVQTEDMGRIASTPELATQARFENDRRWLSLDLLCGKVVPGHPLRDWLIKSGTTAEELEWFSRNPCPPDIIGINHYVLSNRFLDHRTALYPDSVVGGNGRCRYADLGAVRMAGHDPAPLDQLLMEVWDRYQLPIAITEAHLDCTREEQLRWLNEFWQAAKKARKAGAEVVAVTAWGLLGLYDWRGLLTRNEGNYETGVFDLTSGTPRPTALASCVKALATTGQFNHPLLQVPGWWRRDIRILHPQPSPALTNPTQDSALPPTLHRRVPPLLIAAGTGRLGEAFARMAALRGIPCRLLDSNSLDASDPTQMQAVLAELRPWAVIHAAGYLRGDETSQTAPARLRENEKEALVLARACAEKNLPCLTFSHDLVFDGGSHSPYTETCAIRPLNAYGQRTAASERNIRDLDSNCLIIRTGTLFGPWDQENFLSAFLRRLREGREAPLQTNSRVSATYIPDLVNQALDLLIDQVRGIWHLVNQGETTPLDFIRQAAQANRLDTGRLYVLDETSPPDCLLSPWPAYSVLGTGRGALLPPLGEATERCFREYRSHL